MPVVVVDPQVFDGPSAPAVLAALVDELGGDPTLLCFDGDWPPGIEVDPSTRTSLRRLPALSVAVACPDPAVAAAFDLAVVDADALAPLRVGFEQAPYASVSAALLLRDAPDDTWAGLVAESGTYSLLQAGPEFRRWLASRCAPRPAREDDAERVTVERRGAIHEIVLTRGERHNAFDARMRDQLHAVLRDLAAVDGPIVVRGDGPSFSSGGDLAEFGSSAGPVQSHVLRVTRSVAMLLSDLAPRLVVALHGACIGAGIELPAFASRVIAADTARFALPELKLGLVPGAGGTVSIRRRIGRAFLLELLLSGRTIDTATARRSGLVDEVVPLAQLRDRAYAIAESMT